MSKTLKNFWNDKKVLVTGHTGFKGSWLCLILNYFGAEVFGYALKPSTTPSLYDLTELNQSICSKFSDIRDYDSLNSFIIDSKPEIIFHMAAQPIVRESYLNPKETFEINALGTLNLFESLKSYKNLKAVVNITTDKCYENPKGNKKAFREDDKLGGYDPYAASKACSEIITASYRQSFFNDTDSPVVATARGGNVIGGGDWGKDRLLPDFFRAIENNKPFSVRNPQSIRPWQHVLDALNGYICLAEKLYSDGKKFAGAWNIGPYSSEYKTVKFVVEQVINQWPGSIDCQFGSSKSEVHEATFLVLDCSKAAEKLDWKPQWNTEETINKTVEWFKGYVNGESPRELCLKQINEF